MTSKQFMKKYNLTENQFYGRKEFGGNLYLGSLTSIPEGFNPTVGGWLDLSSLTSIPEGFNPTVGGSLYLGSLTSIPEGFNPTVGGNLDLSSLTSIPEGFNPTVGGWLDLGSLTSIPEGFNPTVGGSLHLSSLTSIPEGFNPTVGGNLDLSSLTSIPEGFNPTVGGNLDLRSGSQPSKKKPSKNFEQQHRFSVELSLTWQNGKYRVFDGVFCEVIRKLKNAFKVKIRGKVQYIVTDGENFSHGETIKQAKADLIYKISSRDTSQYQGLTLDSIVTKAEAIQMYRVITGACEAGTKHFVSGLGETKAKYKIKELIKLTAGQYGSETFKNFFGE